jgi:hypothetical protein
MVEEPALYLTSKHGGRGFARIIHYSKVIYSKRVWKILVGAQEDFFNLF